MLVFETDKLEILINLCFAILDHNRTIVDSEDEA